ncbi:hypothetical protein GCM10010136_25310 [Limoniibacter endophyticus]|uniref:Uncharacterized protein n=1 Tax=Limoniibacter endophyticus TaxID=1565040 RepID=A0A8J3DNZ1_9HYPH|nr:hypothetical protein GCM10010136_25310 [Limoniibacter endophyticus]
MTGAGVMTDVIGAETAIGAVITGHIARTIATMARVPGSIWNLVDPRRATMRHAGSIVAVRHM